MYKSILSVYRKYFNKIALISAALLIFQVPILQSAFKDTTDKMSEASDSFTSEGLFEFFIYQYGEDLFRPDGYVTRGTLLLVLNEYHMLVTKVMEQNSLLISKVDSLSGKRDQRDVQSILSRLKKDIDPVLEGSQLIKKIQEARSETVSQEIDGLRKDIAFLDQKLKKLVEIYSGDSKMAQRFEQKVEAEADSRQQVAVLNKEFNELKGEVSGLKTDVYLQKQQLSGISDKDINSQIKDINTRIMDLQRDLVNIKVSGVSSDKTGVDPKSIQKMVSLSGKIDNLEENIEKEKATSEFEFNYFQDEIKDLKKSIAQIKESAAVSKGKKERKDEAAEDLESIKNILEKMSTSIEGFENRIKKLEDKLQ